MKKLSQTVSIFFAIGLLFTSSSSFAIPTLGFGGSITYTADVDASNPVDLDIFGRLLPGADLSYEPDLASSTVMLSADFLSASSDGTYTTGLFGTTPAANDLLISDTWGSNALLTGNVSTLLLTGKEGGFSGLLQGTINITGGLLADDFGGVGSLFAINFILDATFNPDMFNSDFFGVTNGSITKVEVPEPMPIALLSIGLLGMTITRKFYRRG